MAKVKKPATAPEIPASAATAPKVKRSAPAAAKVKGSAPTATEATTAPKVKRSAPATGKVKGSAAPTATEARTAPKVKWSAPTAAKVKRSAPAATEATAADTTSATKGTPEAAAIVIEIPSSPDYSEGCGKGSSRKKGRKWSAPPLDLDDEIQMWTPRQKRRLEEDCQILSGDPLAAAEVAPATTAGNDDIEVVAERGKVACRDFPHPRSVCAKNPFNTTPHERHCDKCFCYVCDIAAPCVSCKGPGGHCHTSEKDMRWKNMRSLKSKINTKKA